MDSKPPTEMAIPYDQIGGEAPVRALVERTGVDELMVTTNTHDGADRIRSYELLSGVLAPAPTG